MRLKRNIEPVDLFLCEWVGKASIIKMSLVLSDRPIEQKNFEKGLRRIISSPLTKDAFRKLIYLGERYKKSPLDSVNPSNWNHQGIANEFAFKK